VIDLGQLELHRRGPTLRWELARIAFAAFPRWAERTLEIASARLCASRIPSIFSRDLHEIPPSLNDDLLDLFGRCERTLSNQFAFLSHSEEFEEEIDWARNQSTAWCTEMHAFDYGLDLALNYRISGDPRYARHLRYLMAHWIACNPPGQGDGWLLPPLARRIRNWVLAADLARQDWEKDAAFFSIINRSLALQAQFLSCYASTSQSLETTLDSARALALAGRFFGGSRGAELSAAGSQMLAARLDRSFDANGRLILSRPGAHLRLAQAMIEFIAFQRGQLAQDADFVSRLGEILAVMAGSLLPDGTQPLFGVSPAPLGEELADVFALAALILNSPEWKVLAGKFGIMPYMILGEPGWVRFQGIADAKWMPANCLQPHAGLYRLSGADSSAMVINARQPVDLSDHQDGFSYELAFLGQRVVVDSGVYLPEWESQQQYFATSGAHNVLLIDGEGPNCAGHEDIHSTAAITEPDGETMGLRLTHSGFSRLGIAHQRAWFRLGSCSWVVLDHLDGVGRHRATSLMHFYPTFELEVREKSALARSRSLTVSVVPLGPTHPHIFATRGKDPKFEGWYSPAIGTKYAAGVLRLEWEIVSWPWIGGYLIVPGSETSFEVGESDPTAKEVSFRLDEKDYKLSLAGVEGSWRLVV